MASNTRGRKKEVEELDLTKIESDNVSVDLDLKIMEDIVSSIVEKKKSVLESLINDLSESPELAVNLVERLGKITKPWEPIGSSNSKLNEIPVPPGESPKSFIKKQDLGPFISGYKLVTIFGDEIASIIKDTPKWKIVILGEYQVDAPFVQHGQKAETNAKTFAEEKLREKGFVIPKI